MLGGGINPFRYCVEYWDKESGTYYLRARYYAPSIGRFTQQDTHWNTANMIYGDNPQKINEREDKLGLTAYTMVPQITAVMQAGNLYVYGLNNPILYRDENGEWIHIAIGAGLGFLMGGLISFGTQLLSTGKVDGWRVLIAAASGGLSGALAATGVGLAGQIIGNTAIGAVSSFGDQLYLNGGDITKMNIADIMIGAFVGAVGGTIGGAGGGSTHLNNLTAQLFKRVGNAVKYQAGDALKNEISRAVAYYAKSATKETLKIVHSILYAGIPSVIKGGADIINAIFAEYGIFI